MNKILKVSSLKITKQLNVLIKLSLLICFIVAIFWPPEAVAGKGMFARAPIFLASSVLIPLVHIIKYKKNPFTDKNYNHLADLLIATPFLLDTLGNLLGFYNNFNSTDDVLHFINWLFLIPGIMSVVYKNRSDIRDYLLIGAGISALCIVGWEAFEWLISDAGPLAGKTPDTLTLSYGDTIGDLLLSTSGGFLGVLILKVGLLNKNDKSSK
jgi:hypothetical protein